MHLRSASRDRGAVLPLVALVLVALIAFASIAIDIGYGRVIRRDLQAKADVIALDLVRRLDGSTRSVLEASSGWTTAQSQSRARNDFSDASGRTFTAVLGAVDSNGDFTASGAGDVPSAVQVTLSEDFDFYFRPGNGRTTRSAIATQAPTADFMIGSFLAGTDPDLNRNLLNRLLPRFVGSAVDDLGIDLVSYQGLANATIPLGNLAAQLGFGSPEQLLSAGVVNARDVYLASASVLDSQGDTAAANVFRTMSTTVSSSTTMNLANYMTVSQGTGGAAAGAGVSLPSFMPALPFLNATAMLINGTNTISVPNFDLGIPNLSATTLTLKVTERPQVCLGCGINDSRSTAQVQVHIGTTFGASVDSLLGPLGLGTFGLANATIGGSISLDTTAAGATARLTAAYCAGNASGQTPQIRLNVTTNPLTTTVNESLKLNAKVLLLTQDIASVTVTNAGASATGTGGTASFNYTSEFLPSVGSGTTKRVGSPNLGLSTALSATSVNTALLGTKPLSIVQVDSIFNAAVAPTVATLDTFVTRTLARTLGLDVGGGDVGAMQLYCGSPRLVG